MDLAKIGELIIGLTIGSGGAMAVNYLWMGSKVRIIRGDVKNCRKDLDILKNEFRICQEEKPKELNFALHDLTLVVDSHVKTTNELSSTLSSHLQAQNATDDVTRGRFVRIESQLNRIEEKLDQLKGWRVVRG